MYYSRRVRRGFGTISDVGPSELLRRVWVRWFFISITCVTLPAKNEENRSAVALRGLQMMALGTGGVGADRGRSNSK
eukprot:scaffold7947_cov52-Cyclotella_meneghiniana.AAC.2